MGTAARLLGAGVAALALSGAAAWAQGVVLDPGAAVVAVPEAGPASPPTPEAGAAADAAAAAGSEPTTVAPAPAAAQRDFTLRQIRFLGPSAYRGAQDLSQIAAQLTGRRYARAALGDIAAALTQAAYGSIGVGTAQAVIRDADFSRGVIEVELLEARLGRIVIDGGIVSEEYLRARLGEAPGALADNRRIATAAEALQITDGLPVTLTYAPGTARGTTDLTLSLPPIPRHVTVVTLDNYGSFDTGQGRLTLAHTVNSLTGWNDPLTLSTTLSEGSAALALSYARPVAANGARLSLALAGTRTRSITGPATRGRTLTGELALSVPVIARADRTLTLLAGVGAFAERGTLLGVPNVDQRGVEGHIGLAGSVTGARFTLRGGLRYLFGSYDERIFGARIGYSAVAFNLTPSVLVGDDAFFSVALGGQSALGRPMPAARRIAAAGPAAVRGYPTNLGSSDSAWYARFQFEKATPWYPQEGGSGGLGLRPFAFFDTGEGFDAAGVGQGRLASVGVGVSLTAGERLFGDLYVARPLRTNVTGWASPSKAPVLRGALSIRF